MKWWNHWYSEITGGKCGPCCAVQDGSDPASVRPAVLRRTADEISANICYRWFLGYTLQEETPHFSTVSYNFRHRFTAETVDQVFAWILEEVAEAGYLSPKAVFIDGTHIKANANTKKQIKEQVPVASNIMRRS